MQTVWTMPAVSNLLLFNNDPRYFGGDATLRLVLESSSRNAMTKFVRKSLSKTIFDFNRAESTVLKVKRNIEPK